MGLEIACTQCGSRVQFHADEDRLPLERECECGETWTLAAYRDITG